MRYLISGTRNGSVLIEDLVFEVLGGLVDQEPFLILGDADGVDQYAKNFAELHYVDHSVLYARWSKEGRRAGPARNIRMFWERPDRVIAFPSADSVGTRHVIDRAERMKIPTEIYEV